MQQSIQPEHGMAKGQQKSNKEGKKPKKDTSAPKVPSGEPVRATIVTAVVPRGKDKDKKK
jgi:hypothetical protein